MFVESARGANRHVTRSRLTLAVVHLQLVADGERSPVHLGADDLNAVGVAAR